MLQLIGRCLLQQKTRVALSFALLIGLAPAPASAAQLLLTYTGSLHAADSLTTGNGPDLLTADSSFTFTALFDTSTPNAVAPLPNPGPGRGFVAYVPSQASFMIGNVQYALAGLGGASGPTIAIFDRTNIFNPDRYGVGLIVNPLADGAGFVADFLSASPDFSVTALSPTIFQNFVGVGFSPGIGCGPDPALCTFQPIALTSGGQSYALQFGGTPGVVEGGVSYEGGTTTAVLTAIPEPGTWVITMLGFGLLGARSRQLAKAGRATIL